MQLVYNYFPLKPSLASRKLEPRSPNVLVILEREEPKRNNR